MAEFLDIAQPIIEVDPDTKELKATPYFEDYLYGIIAALGGEGSTIISEVVASGVQADKVPYLFGLVANLSKRVSDLESQLCNHVLEATVKQLQIDTAIFDTNIAVSNYTAKNKDFKEGRNGITFKLPANAQRGDQVMFANGDGSTITVDGNGTDIKYTSTDRTFIMRTEGSSYHFHLFVDNPNNTKYWRVI